MRIVLSYLVKVVWQFLRVAEFAVAVGDGTAWIWYHVTELLVLFDLFTDVLADLRFVLKVWSSQFLLFNEMTELRRLYPVLMVVNM